MAQTPNPEGSKSMTWLGWTLVLAVAGACVVVGEVAASLAGFPLYKGYQGVLSQQPVLLVVKSVVAMILAVLVSMRIAIPLLSRWDSRLGSAIALVSLLGFVRRGGGMGSVMLAADGGGVFWGLAIETLGLGVLVLGAFLLRHSMGGAKDARTPADVDAAAAGMQAAIFIALMWLLGQSYLPQQGTWGVFVAGAGATVFTQMILGRTWRGAWAIPGVVGVLGFVANALTAQGVEVAKLTGPVAGLAMASPLEYVAMGAAGIVCGEFIHGMEDPEEQADGSEPAGAKAA